MKRCVLSVASGTSRKRIVVRNVLRLDDQLVVAMLTPGVNAEAGSLELLAFEFFGRELVAGREFCRALFKLVSLRESVAELLELCLLLSRIMPFVPEKSNAIIGVVTTGSECLPPSCDGLTGPDLHGPMISTG
ncbi:hypothetical protein F511_24496 [Dorcoceras hygrometricum]|uniref:Uncharacterized protein n=1 Tax=Dorcoceras hygrometricum TaxID=472368 RepID=A0A2Z7CLT2_9LAMI|nr:hypothetical protein F511_24496 [Dorcoceras hygrometricum]